MLPRMLDDDVLRPPHSQRARLGASAEPQRPAAANLHHALRSYVTDRRRCLGGDLTSSVPDRSPAASSPTSSENAPRARGVGQLPRPARRPTSVRPRSPRRNADALPPPERGETSVPSAQRVARRDAVQLARRRPTTRGASRNRAIKDLGYHFRSCPAANESISRFIAAKACPVRLPRFLGVAAAGAQSRLEPRFSADATVASRGVAWSASARALFCVARASNAARCLSVSAGTSNVVLARRHGVVVEGVTAGRARRPRLLGERRVRSSRRTTTGRATTPSWPWRRRGGRATTPSRRRRGRRLVDGGYRRRGFATTCRRRGGRKRSR